MEEQEIKINAYIFALENAIKHNGKASKGAIIGKLIAMNPSIKQNIKDIENLLDDIIDKVNSLNEEKQLEELKKLDEARYNALFEKKEKKMPELPNAIEGKVVTRIPPEPSKYPHIGHALSFLINYVYAKKYNGRTILRFEDTNPLKASQEYVDAIYDGLDYIGIKPDEIRFASDDMELLYSYAERLIDENKAYVCFCDRDKIAKLRAEGKECGCREKNSGNNKEEWRKMLEGKYQEGECVLRLKGDMKSKNFVMRDPVIFRIIKQNHFRQKNKYVVWPMYDFENSIEDSIMGITHILRSNEFGNMRIELQNYIKDLLKLSKQTIVQYGRFNIIGGISQGREIRDLITSGKVKGWDDPRLVTLKALKRRGIVKETYLELVKQVGLSNTPTNIDWSLISALNRKIIDDKTPRYFFIKEPVEIEIESVDERIIQVKNHPTKDLGTRSFKINGKFIIEKEDYEKFESGKIYRLMDCLNFKKEKDKFLFHSFDYKELPKNSTIVHWLPSSKENIEVSILMPDGNEIKGFGEKYLKELEEGSIIQFQRFGFCRLDSKEKMLFVFSHK